MQNRLDELLRSWEVDVDYLEPFLPSDEYEMTNLSLGLSCCIIFIALKQ